MKRTLVIIAMTVAAVCAFQTTSFAQKARSNAKFEIDKGIKLKERIEADKELEPFYPHIQYNRAFTHLSEAIHQFENRKEYEYASYFAVLANVEFETARTIAEARSLRHRALEKEVQFYKNAAKEQMLKAAIIAANLEKQGKAYQGVVEDRNLFVGKTLTVEAKAKKNILDKILDVVKLYPNTKIIIKGHTRFTDRDNARSIQKAKSVAEYFTIEKGLKEDMVSVKGMGNTQPMIVKTGGREFAQAADRVEFIITGVIE